MAITRGGANTLSELSFLNIPYVAIPLPTARDNHQYYNSNYYFEKNCCWLVDQNKYETNNFLKTFLEILNNYQIYRKKITNLENITKKNNWNNINSNIIEIIHEN